MTPASTRGGGKYAAFGRRRPREASIRRALLNAVRQIEWRMTYRTLPDATHLRVIPEPRTRSELADLAGRVNWFLPKDLRKLPLHAGTAGAGVRFGEEDAPHIDPTIVVDPGFIGSRPAGHGHLVVTRVTPATAVRWLLAGGRATTVDPGFAYGADQDWFQLAEKACAAPGLPGPTESVSRLARLRRQGATAFVLATGPSAKLIDPVEAREQAEIRITCNSAVRDRDLLAALQPQVIAFGDPVFHFGPSRYAAAFRSDLRRAIDETDALFATTTAFSRPLLAHMPEIAERLIALPMEPGGTWRWPSLEDPSIRQSGNVLTNLMLPIAFMLADHVEIAGCDGRNPDEDYFWKHNPSTQYADDLMQTAFDSHIAFFKYRVYEDYYEEHCAQLEEFLSIAEAAGKSAAGTTPSHIEALRRRGAPIPD